MILPFSDKSDVRDAPFHKTHPSLKHCVDFALPIGTPILAVKTGLVVEAVGRYKKNYLDPAYQDRTNRVVIKHGRTTTVYAHLQSVNVKVGQIVQQGEQVGTSGDTGYATYPHLHFGVYEKGVGRPFGPVA